MMYWKSPGPIEIFSGRSLLDQKLNHLYPIPFVFLLGDHGSCISRAVSQRRILIFFLYTSILYVSVYPDSLHSCFFLFRVSLLIYTLLCFQTKKYSFMFDLAD